MDNIERNNESQIELYTRLLGGLIIQEPKGYANDSPSFKRDKQSKGILSKTEINLEFYGNGAEWLTTVFEAFGIQETVLIIKHEKDLYSINERWTARYIQEVDMSSYDKDVKTGRVTVSATEGGLYDKIKKRKSKKYNLITTQSADGDEIGAIKTYDFQPQPRDIFLESLMEDTQTEYRVNSQRFDTTTAYSHRTIPLRPGYKSDEKVQFPSNTDTSVNDLIPHAVDQQTVGSIQNTGDQFILRADRSKTVRVKIDLEFKISRIDKKRATSGSTYVKVELRRSELDVNSDNVLHSSPTVIFTDTEPIAENTLQTISFDQEIDIEEGDSYACVFATKFSPSGPRDGWFDVYFNVIKSKLVIEDTTPFPVTVSRCMKPFDLFERIIAKITGKNNLFKSNVFGIGGDYEDMVVDNGFWARGFPDSITEADDNEKEIQFNTSFIHAFNAYNLLEPLCWFTEVVGKQEVVRIEKATHTMKNFIGVRLPSVDKIVDKGQKKEFFTGAKIGHKKSLEYEEINGLDEPNGLSEFGTHVSKGEMVYDISVEYRNDSVAYELVRRKPFSLFPKEDTPRDKDIFMHDAKYVNGIYYHNLWGDWFDSAPTGIFSPETAWNLRLSPMNRLFYGHGYSIKRGLYHFPQKSVRFDSSNANQNLKTTYNGKTLHEGGSFLVGDLEKARIEPLAVEMTFAMTQDIENQIKGTTNVDGEEVPNFFGLFEYQKEGATRYGRLVSLKADEESKLTLINARL